MFLYVFSRHLSAQISHDIRYFENSQKIAQFTRNRYFINLVNPSFFPQTLPVDKFISLILILTVNALRFILSECILLLSLKYYTVYAFDFIVVRFGKYWSGITHLFDMLFTIYNIHCTQYAFC
jgi:hypothetical protein